MTTDAQVDAFEERYRSAYRCVDCKAPSNELCCYGHHQLDLHAVRAALSAAAALSPQPQAMPDAHAAWCMGRDAAAAMCRELADQSYKAGRHDVEQGALDCEQAIRALLPPAQFAPAPDVMPEWIVNDIAELGVKVGNRFFFLYKGESLEYRTGLHDDDRPVRWRLVYKREFGECCHPWVTIEHRTGSPSMPDDFPAAYGNAADWQELPRHMTREQDDAEYIRRLSISAHPDPAPDVERMREAANDARPRRIKVTSLEEGMPHGQLFDVIGWTGFDQAVVHDKRDDVLLVLRPEDFRAALGDAS